MALKEFKLWELRAMLKNDVTLSDEQRKEIEKEICYRQVYGE